MHNVDHLIFHKCMLCHAPSPWEQNAVLQDYSIIDGTGWWHQMVERSSIAQGATGFAQERVSGTIGQCVEFRASGKSGDWGQKPQRRLIARVPRDQRASGKTEGRRDYVPLASR
jgi:hypothetical protein